MTELVGLEEFEVLRAYLIFLSLLVRSYRLGAGTDILSVWSRGKHGEASRIGRKIVRTFGWCRSLPHEVAPDLELMCLIIEEW